MKLFSNYCHRISNRLMFVYTLLFFWALLSLLPGILSVFDHDAPLEERLLLLSFTLNCVFGLFLAVQLKRLLMFFKSGELFSEKARELIQLICRCALLTGACIQPAAISLLMLQSGKMPGGMEIMAGTNIPLIVLAVALHLLMGATKVAQDVSEENELTI